MKNGCKSVLNHFTNCHITMVYSIKLHLLILTPIGAPSWVQSHSFTPPFIQYNLIIFIITSVILTFILIAIYKWFNLLEHSNFWTRWLSLNHFNNFPNLNIMNGLMVFSQKSIMTNFLFIKINSEIQYILKWFIGSSFVTMLIMFLSNQLTRKNQ